MANNFWKNIKNFRPTEKNIFGKEAFPYPEQMNPTIVFIVDRLRDYVMQPIIVHSTNEEYTTHTSNSQHYYGNAIDFHIKNLDYLTAVDKTIEFIDSHFLLAKPLRFYMGIGIYPDWNNPGFHLDFRGYSATWSRIGSDYVSFDEGLKYALDKFRP